MEGPKRREHLGEPDVDERVLLKGIRQIVIA
jgi:hypothetical protein